MSFRLYKARTKGSGVLSLEEKSKEIMSCLFLREIAKVVQEQQQYIRQHLGNSFITSFVVSG